MAAITENFFHKLIELVEGSPLQVELFDWEDEEQGKSRGFLINLFPKLDPAKQKIETFKGYRIIFEVFEPSRIKLAVYETSFGGKHVNDWPISDQIGQYTFIDDDPWYKQFLRLYEKVLNVHSIKRLRHQEEVYQNFIDGKLSNFDNPIKTMLMGGARGKNQEKKSSGPEPKLINFGDYNEITDDENEEEGE